MKYGPISPMKLEKLAYYSQAWSLVWDERPMFNERIEAWVGGPVVPALYDKHRGEFSVKEWPWGDESNLDKDARDTIDIVLRDYSSKSAQALSDLTHSEKPWIEARRGLADNERGNKEISLDTMREFYSELHHTVYG